MTVPDTVTNIGTCAFADNTTLKTVNLGNSVESIGSLAFFNCSSLEELYIPSSVTEIREDAFSGCDNLTIVCDEGSAAQQYASDNNIPYRLRENDGPKDMIYGDIDGDGKITAKDSLSIARHVVKIRMIAEERLPAADVNKDGKITNKDSLEILRYTINMSKNENIGNAAA